VILEWDGTALPHRKMDPLLSTLGFGTHSSLNTVVTLADWHSLSHFLRLDLSYNYSLADNVSSPAISSRPTLRPGFFDSKIHRRQPSLLLPLNPPQSSLNEATLQLTARSLSWYLPSCTSSPRFPLYSEVEDVLPLQRVYFL